jgi:hypothetical protein
MLQREGVIMCLTKQMELMLAVSTINAQGYLVHKSMKKGDRS